MASKTKKTDTNNKPKARIAANGYRLCDPLPKGEVLTDSTNKQWILGSPIGCGGFGEIYSCSRSGDRNEYVMKLDNIDGPLFAEMNFYIRVAKEEAINDWINKKRSKFLGIPRYIASGIHDKSPNNSKTNTSSLKAKRTGPTLQYRFLVMQRFGDELQKLINDKKLTTSKACDIASKMIDVLEYIHSFGYIHADIKATNILRANPKPAKTGDQNYYLVDYGLAERYRNPDGRHREEKPDKKRANNGTVEFRSRDAHIGLISRRSDIECLAYNLIQWLYGSLPWIKQLSDANKVQQLKEYFMANIDEFLDKCFGRKSVPKGMKEFLQEISKIKFDSEPKYDSLKNILTAKVAKNKIINDNDDEDNEEVNASEEAMRNSPKKRRSNAKSGLSSKKSSKKSPNQVIIISDDEENEPSCSPPKRARNNKSIKSNNGNTISPKKAGFKSGSKPAPRYSTPLLFCTSSEDNSDSEQEEKEESTAGGDVETPHMMEIRKLMEKKKRELEVKKRRNKKQ